MNTDLVSLLVLALWTLPLNHIPAVGRIKAAGTEWAMGNRDTIPDVPAWVGRADRAKQNHHDNLTMIAIVILMLQVTQQADQISAIASILVVVFRISHSLVYIFAIPVVRSLAYFGSILALLTLVWRLFA